MRPYFHKVCIAPFDGTTRTTAFVLFPKRASDLAYATMLTHLSETVDYAARHSTGSTIPYAVWDGSLEHMPIVLPPEDIRSAFDVVMRPILDCIPIRYFEVRALAALRDTLLPELISGELRVKAAERLVEAVGADHADRIRYDSDRCEQTGYR
jgi:type I restriction enzyme S subunit